MASQPPPAPGPREKRLAAYLEGLAHAAGHRDRWHPVQNYCLGLLLPGERKSVQCASLLTQVYYLAVYIAHRSPASIWFWENFQDAFLNHSCPKQP
jgi:hypothetical protein